MMVEPKKLQRIALVIQQQASLLRRAGSLSQAAAMERRASELHDLCAAQMKGLSGMRMQAA